MEVRQDNDLIPEHFEDIDLVITLGGDHTVLKTHGFIKNQKTPILGINTFPGWFKGALCSTVIEPMLMQKQIQNLAMCIHEEDFCYFYRSRAKVSFNKKNDPEFIDYQCEVRRDEDGNPTVNQKCMEYLVLNEVFASEDDPACTSMYRLNIDGREMGKFKSSGIIIATGTGSGGWLYQAKQMTRNNVSQIKEFLGKKDQSIVNETLAK